MSKKWVFSILFVLVALTVSAHFLLQSTFFSKKIEGLAESALETALGKKVSIGKAQLDLLSSSVILETLSVHSDLPNEAPLFSAKSLRVFFSLESLFTEITVIRKIQIDAPEIKLTDATLAQISFNKVENKNTSLAGDAPTPAFVVRAVQVADGQMIYTGVDGLKTASLSGLVLEINPDLTMRRFELGVIAKAGSFSNNGFAKEIDHFEAQVMIQPNKIEVKNAQIASEKSALRVHGTIDLERKDALALMLDLRLPIDPDVIPGLSTPLKDELRGQALSGELAFVGEMTGTIQDPSLEGTLALPNLSEKDEEIGTLNAKLAYDTKLLTLSDISGTLFSGTFSGALEASLAAETIPETEMPSKGLQARLQYADLPADRLMDKVPFSDPAKVPSLKGLFITGKMEISAPRIRAEDIEAKGEVFAKRLPLFSPPVPEDATPLKKGITLFKSGKMQWIWSSKGLLVNEATLDFPQLHLTLNGTWDPGKSYAFETALVSADVTEVAHAFHIPLSGKLHVNGHLSQQEDLPAFEGAILAESGALKGQSFTSLFSEVSLQGKRLGINKAILRIPPKNAQKKFPSPAGQYAAAGVLHFNHLKKPDFDLKVDVRDGNPQEVFRFLNLKIPLYATANGSLLVQGTATTFSVKGPLEISTGSLYGEHFEQGWVDLTVTEKEVLFENAILNHQKSLLRGKGAIAYNKTYWLSIKGEGLQVQDRAFLHWIPRPLRARVGLVVSGKGSFAAPQLHFVAAVKNLRYGELKAGRGTIKADWVKHTVDFEANFPENKVAITGGVQLEPTFPFSFDTTFEAFQIDPFFKEKVSGPLSDLHVRASGKLRGNGILSEWERTNISGHLHKVSADFGDYLLQNTEPLPILARDGMFSFQNAHFKGENTALTLNGNLTVLKRWGLFLKGEADLNLLTFFSKRISAGSGKVNLDLAISDAWDSPKLRGELKMADGKLRAVNWSQPIQVTGLSTLFNERQVVLENLQGRIGGGNFRAAGKAKLSGFKVNDFGFLLELNKVRADVAKNLPATISGELFLQKKAEEQTLKGDLTIKNVVYDKKMDLKQFVLDFTQKKRNTLSEETPIIGQTLINIHLYGNEEIWIDNNLAKLPLVVDLLVKGSFDEPNLLGRVDIPDGDVYFRHNTFHVVSGAVNFLDLEEINPSFEMTARTDVRNISTDRNYAIDLNLAGTMSQVTLTWNAFPALSDTDILSLLAIRKTTADLALEEGGAGTEATNFVVTEFLAEPVDQITGMIGEPVENITGIDQIRVEPSIEGTSANTTVGTRLTAEKRLMKDRLVVIYTTTLDPSEEEVIRMVYEINKNISLVGKREEDGQMGGDIRFRFEIR